MTDSDAVTLYEMSAEVRHFEIAFGRDATARLFLETFADAKGRQRSTCRLYFDREVGDAELEEVTEAVRRAVLDKLPPGLCTVYACRLRRTLDIGSERVPV